MQFGTKLVGLTAFLSSAMAAITVPEYFLLKSKLVPGQKGKAAFNNLEMSPYTVPADVLDAVFVPGNYEGYFFSLEETHAPKTDGHTFYSLKFNESSKGPVFRAQMLYNVAAYASWQPMSFIATTSDGDSKMQNGFYLNQTSSGLELLWTDNYKTLDEGDFVSWLLCDWWFGYPQLFFVTIYANAFGLKLPSTCAEVTLQVIPLPNN